MRNAQEHSLSPDVRAAIRSFLNDIQGDGQSFAISAAMDAVRRVFPDVEVSDTDLLDAIASEASTAGFDIEYETDQRPKALKRIALERWDNEGGAAE